MGEYFYYANHDKKLKFSVSLSQCSDKFRGISYCHLSTRDFCMMLTKSDHFNYVNRHTLIGSWIGNRVSCIGDQTRWNYDDASYLNISANVIVMLYQIDGEEQLIKTASEDDVLFVQLAHLIFTRQLVDILPAFRSRFGAEWTKRYKQILQEHFYYHVFDIVDLTL